MDSKHKLKLLVIGLDGATWDVINPLAARDELPNIKSLIDDGSSGQLASTIPPFSAPAWSTFMTGMNPGKHGIFGFVNFNPQSYSQIDSSLVTSAPLVGHTIFDILSESDLRLAALSVPITYPSWPINGFMVSGEPCPDSDHGLAFPETFAAGLSRRYAFQSTFWSRSNDEIIAGLYEMDESRAKLAIKLISEEDLDALFVVLGATDRVQHNFWRFHDSEFGARLGLPHETRYEAVISETYRRADVIIGNILSIIDDSTAVFIISDHGGGPAATTYFHTNAWLQRNGYLKINQNRDGFVSGSRGVALTLKRLLDTPLGSKARSLLPGRFVKQGRALVRNIAQIEWARTGAYRFPMYPPAEGIVINLAGRQSQGIVQPGYEYERLRQEIIGQIGGFTNPDSGAQVVINAFLREELYSGPNIERAPDIVLLLDEEYTGGIELHPPLLSPVYPSSLTKVNGEHRMHGILIARGPDFRKEHTIENASLMDLAPTLLFSLGLPISSEMDGRILEDLFTQEFHAEHSKSVLSRSNMVQSALADRSLSSEEEEQIIKQLSRLGYL